MRTFLDYPILATHWQLLIKFTNSREQVLKKLVMNL